MNYQRMRDEISDYYWNKADKRADDFNVKCEAVLETLYNDKMSSYEMKALQYKYIAEMFEPVLFAESPFYYETGTMIAVCDGMGWFRGNHMHPGGWTSRKRSYLYEKQDEELWQLRQKQGEELLYLICGAYNDTGQHFAFNYRPVFEYGLKGIYEKAADAIKEATKDEERQFLNAVCSGLLCLKKMSEKFAEKAKEFLDESDDIASMQNMQRIYETAKRVPWEKPKTFYEALNTLAFLRKTIGALEGIGFNSFGRIDVDLYPFYKGDIESGKLNKEEAYELICKFLITWDMHYDHDMKMEGYADHELENTYVLGGCNADGKPVYNELTKMFLTASREEKIIFPKIKCRFSKESPKEYLDEINTAVINGTSIILFQNDDATIPALIRSGRTQEEAMDYLVTGCWGVQCNGVEKFDGGSYVNLLKAFEYSIHNRLDKMEKTGMYFKPIDDAKTFDEVYHITCDNMRILLEERARITREGGNIWSKVSPLPLFSSTLDACIANKKDFTAGGAKYNDEQFLCFGLPNIVDSLLAIKELCFDTKKYTLSQLLAAVRSNWEGCELMRAEAISCHGWGDGSEESCTLGNQFNNDLYKITTSLVSTRGGKVHLSHLTYTEILWWGKETGALPDGRRNGEYFAQGLTPSRLKKISSVTDVINSMARIDASTIAGNSVVNIILPSEGMTLDLCEGFLRATAQTAIQSLQLNCTTKEQLLDAQKHPEKYPDLIVRVTGFSAKFTSLSEEWQNEVITRNFYK